VAFDCRCDERPELVKPEFAASGCFHVVDERVEIRNLLADLVLVSPEVESVQLVLCVVTRARRYRRVGLHQSKESSAAIFLSSAGAVVCVLVAKYDVQSFVVAHLL
jgi:hypothetical protein